VKFPTYGDVFIYDDVLILPYNEDISTWDISDPLNIRPIVQYTMDSPYCDCVLHDKKLFLNRPCEIRIEDVSDPANIKKIALFSCKPYIMAMTVSADGTIWAVTRDGAIGTYDLTGAFTEYVPADASILYQGRYNLDIKVTGDLVVVANQGSVYIFKIQAIGKLELLKKMGAGQACFGTPIETAANGKAILLTSFYGMDMIDVSKPDKIKKLKKFKDSQVELHGGIIDFPEKQEILTCGSMNDKFKIFLLSLTDAGPVCKESIKMKGYQYSSYINMFIKGNYLVIMTGDNNSFEVHEIINI
jgi:hypothetical protein